MKHPEDYSPPQQIIPVSEVQPQGTFLTNQKDVNW